MPQFLALKSGGALQQIRDFFQQGSGDVETQFVSPSSLTTRKYTIGPAFSGAEYPTVQAAVDAAVADGNSVGFGGVAFWVYPGFYNENVVIPSTLVHWHFDGIGADVGAYIQQLTITLPNGVGDWSFSKIGITNLTITEPTSGAGNIFGRFWNCWFYGAVSINAPDLQLEYWDSAFASGSSHVFVGARLRMAGCFTRAASSSDVALDATCSIGLLLRNNYWFGRVLADSPAFGFIGNVSYFGSGFYAVEDSGNGGFSEFQTNAFHLNGPTQMFGVLKSGTNSLSENGNSWADGINAPFFDVTGTGGTEGKIGAEEIFSRTSVRINGQFNVRLGLKNLAGTYSPAIRIVAGTISSLATDRVLVWDGGGSLYRDSQDALFATELVDVAAFALSQADAERKLHTIECDTATAGAIITVTLPDPTVTRVGTRVTVKDAVGNAGTLRIDVVSAGGGTIDGAASDPLTTNWRSQDYVVMSTGEWGTV